MLPLTWGCGEVDRDGGGGRGGRAGRGRGRGAGGCEEEPEQTRVWHRRRVRGGIGGGGGGGGGGDASGQESDGAPPVKQRGLRRRRTSSVSSERGRGGGRSEGESDGDSLDGGFPPRSASTGVGIVSGGGRRQDVYGERYDGSAVRCSKRATTPSPTLGLEPPGASAGAGASGRADMSVAAAVASDSAIGEQRAKNLHRGIRSSSPLATPMTQQPVTEGFGWFNAQSVGGDAEKAGSRTVGGEAYSNSGEGREFVDDAHSGSEASLVKPTVPNTSTLPTPVVSSGDEETFFAEHALEPRPRAGWERDAFMEGEGRGSAAGVIAQGIVIQRLAQGIGTHGWGQQPHAYRRSGDSAWMQATTATEFPSGTSGGEGTREDSDGAVRNILSPSPEDEEGETNTAAEEVEAGMTESTGIAEGAVSSKDSRFEWDVQPESMAAYFTSVIGLVPLTKPGSPAIPGSSDPPTPNPLEYVLPKAPRGPERHGDTNGEGEKAVAERRSGAEEDGHDLGWRDCGSTSNAPYLEGGGGAGDGGEEGGSWGW